MQKLLRDKQIAEALGGVSNVTLWRMRQRGQLPQPRKINGQNCTPADEFDEALARLIEQAGAA